MIGKEDSKLIYWFFVFLLLFIPVTNTFCVNVNKLFKIIASNNKYKHRVCELNSENQNLNNKVKYIKTKQGLKSLIKDRLDKVEDGEVIVRFSEGDNL